MEHPGHTFGHLQLVTIKQIVVRCTIDAIAALVTKATPPAPPRFVGNDYFCESGVSSRSARRNNKLFPDDPLWDGQRCIHGNSCCSLNKPPWFNKTLLTPSTDDIEMRLCMLQAMSGGDIALEQLELYVY